MQEIFLRIKNKKHMEKILNLLFVGDLNQGGRSLQRCETLEILGHNVSRISSIPIPFIAGTDHPSLMSRILWKLKLPLDANNENLNIQKIVNQNKFDVVWIDKGVTIHPKTLERIKKKMPKCVLVSCSEDDMYAKHNRSWWYVWGLKYYDIVFTTKVYNLSELKTLGARKTDLFLDSYDENLHRPLILTDDDRENFACDVGFIGTFENDRAEHMLYLAEHGVTVTVWGNGWNGWRNKHRNLVIQNKAVYGEDYVKAINATKINLCFLRKINRDEVTSRSVEIPACGAFMLGERTRRHLDFFEEGKEAEFFDSNEEMLQKVRFYLENNEKRKEIARAGRERCLKSGYSQREQISKMLASLWILKRV